MILAGLGALAGGVPAWYGTKLWYADTVADTRIALKDEQLGRAKDHADASARSESAVVAADRLYRAAEEGLRLRTANTLALIVKGNQDVALQLHGLSAVFKETTDDPRWNCLREPLPLDLLRGLRRPGE